MGPIQTTEQMRAALLDHEKVLSDFAQILRPLMNQPSGTLTIVVKNADGTYGIRNFSVGPGATLSDNGTTLSITVP